MSITHDVVCYHFMGSKLERREICKLEDFDTSSVLSWSDGVKTQIRWVSRFSDTPTLDGVPAREYQRDPKTLKILETPSNATSVQCLQALESNNSVCWTR
ncbi:hypothetical protein H6F51_14320 [Cyanobacteria bacterium FACHB-DQ100]|nr:hypothetical protein [Cyanobacteria bacterium FACHB-DQ100]